MIDCFVLLYQIRLLPGIGTDNSRTCLIDSFRTNFVGKGIYAIVVWTTSYLAVAGFIQQPFALFYFTYFSY